MVDGPERKKMKQALQRNFFDAFPQYRFLENCDLKPYEDFYRDYSMYERLRNLLIKGEDEQSYVKINAGKEDDMGVRFTVETQCRGFSSTLAGIYIFSMN